ncbi:MAG: hypothetical protein QM780_04360 [Hyphomicrobium sp.]|uniref:hypothetical protein n=1 Tax=Hyphomicrobium sp. TaxID=82 RepID=UPI0039E68104
MGWVICWLGSARLCVRAAVAQGFSIIFLFFGIAIASAPSAEAHHQRKSGEQKSGVAIGNLSHGQLRIMARYKSAILDLANRQIQLGRDARTLLNFVNLQSTYCLWGAVPGSLSDEDNPFNECTHAYLAASKALLDQLRWMKDAADDAEALANRIDTEMIAEGAALDICRNSLEPFNTAQIVMPAWGEVSFNPLGWLLGGFILMASAAGLIGARSNRRTVQIGS